MVAMRRSRRYAPGGIVFHVLNRGVGRGAIFEKHGDYLAFEKVLDETLRIRPTRLCAYCLLPNTGTSWSGRSTTATLARSCNR
jgi:putative transposase